MESNMQFDRITSTYNCNKQTIYFDIKNFTEDKEHCIQTMDFKIGRGEKTTKWMLDFYPRGFKESTKNFISICLRNLDWERPFKFRGTFSLLENKDENTEFRWFKQKMEVEFKESTFEHFLENFVDRNELFRNKNIFKNNILRLVMEFQIEEETLTDYSEFHGFVTNVAKEGFFNDAEFVADDKVFPVHRLIISAKSNYFLNLFCKNKDQNRFEFKDVSAETMQQIIDYLYERSQISAPQSLFDVAKLYRASKKFKLEEFSIIISNRIECYLAEICGNYRKKKIEPDAAEIYQIAILIFEFPYIDIISKNDAMNMFKRNFDSYKNLPEWKNLIEAQPKVLHNLSRFLTSSLPQCKVKEEILKAEDKLSKDLENLFLSGKHTDLVLEAEGKQIKVHKGIICNRSAVFDSMFNHDMQESKENIVRIEDTKFEVLRELVRFMYCDRIENIKELAIQLFSAADKYELEDLKEICQKYLINNMNAKNVVEILVLADTHQSGEMKELAKFFFLKNISWIPMEDLNWLINFNFNLINEAISKIVKLSTPEL